MKLRFTYIIIFLLLFNFLGQSFAQTRIFYDDFGAPGTEVQKRKIWPYMPTGFNTFVFADPNAPNVGNKNFSEAKAIENNFYAVVSPKKIYESAGNLSAVPPYTADVYRLWTGLEAIGDATPGHNGDGGAMVINAGTTMAAFYVRIANLQAGKYYRLRYQLFIQNTTVKINHHVLSANGGTSVAVYEGVENGQGSGTGSWKQQDYWFFMPETCSSGNYTISVENANRADQGNDFAIDDFLFEMYEPDEVDQSVKDNLPKTAIVNCGIEEPVAFNDEVLMDCNYQGALTLDVLKNDVDENGNRVTPSDFGIRLDVPVGATYNVEDNESAAIRKETIEVKNEGIWQLVENRTLDWSGWPNVSYTYTDLTFTFTPKSGFTGNPTPISYRLYKRSTGGTSGRTFVYIYSECNPRAIDDSKVVAAIVPGQPVTVNIFDNDIPAEGTLAPVDPAKVNKVTLINPYTLLPVSNEPMTVDGEGVWNYVDGQLTFTPQSGFTGTPTPITYTFTDNNGNTSNPAKVSITIADTATPKNYWYGTEDSDWGKSVNWTEHVIPVDKEDVEFATDENNNGKPAIRDLQLDTDRVIGDLINKSDKSLIIPTDKQLIIDGQVVDDPGKSGTIIIKSSPTESTGTLIFSKPELNTSVNVTVEFYNKAYECATCGYYRKQWQYFGIPVQNSDFPYLSPQVETVNQWAEPYNGNKWRPAPFAPDTQLMAFKGYEMTNSSDTEPSHIYSFSGTLNVGNALLPLTKTSAVNYSGMNLISNSFTAAVPITKDAIVYSNELEDETVYLFNTGTRDQWRKLNGGSVSGVSSGQYQSVPINLAGKAGLPDRILSMHTFMLNAKSGGNITLMYDKVVKNELPDDKIAWRSLSSQSELPYVVIDVIGSKSADRVWLFENEDASTGFDNGWDGYKIQEEGIIQAYIQGRDNEKYQIATVPSLCQQVSIESRNNESFVLNISVNTEGESRGLCLQDMLTGRTYSIVDNAEYVIPKVDAQEVRTFKIISPLSSVSEDISQVLPVDIYVKNNAIVVDNQTNETYISTVYDIMGRLIVKEYIRGGETLIHNYGLEKGVYIVKAIGINGGNGKVSRVLLK